jgi:hypothetical protein
LRAAADIAGEVAVVAVDHRQAAPMLPELAPM